MFYNYKTKFTEGGDIMKKQTDLELKQLEKSIFTIREGNGL